MISRPASGCGRRPSPIRRRARSAPAAPIAWNGLVFIGNAGGDVKGVKGRMYALDAKTGKIVWEFYLVPKARGRRRRADRKARRPLDSSTWSNAPGSPITGGATWTSYTLDPDDRPALCARRQSGARISRPAARGRQSLFGLGRRARRQDRRLQEPLQDRPAGLARLGRLQRAGDHPDRGRQEALVGRAQGRSSLRLRSRHQRRCSIASR